MTAFKSKHPRGGFSHPALRLTTVLLLLSLIASAGFATPASAQSDDDDYVRPTVRELDNDEIIDDEQSPLVIAHNVGMVAGFSWEPISSYAGESTANLTNVALKGVPPALWIPDGVTTAPTSGACDVTFRLPQQSASYSNLFGLFDTESIPSDWGLLTANGPAPRVQHANTDVKLTVHGPGVTGDDGPIYVTLDEGNHSFLWNAETQISDLFDVYLPGALQLFNTSVEAKYGKTIGNFFSKKGLTKAAQKDALQVAFNVLLEAGLVTADQFTDTTKASGDAARQARAQPVLVQDIHTPRIEYLGPEQPLKLEAVDYGGIAYQRVRQDLIDLYEISDVCDEPVRIRNDWSDDLIPISDTPHEITWTVSDNPASMYQPGVAAEASHVQRVLVVDEQPPIIVAPPSRVIESFDAVPAGDPALGTPRVVDLADPQPLVTVDNSQDFAVDTRTAVEWTATDASNNSASATQTITIKTPGTNTTPIAHPTSASTTTSLPVDIVLSAEDFDMVGGMPDPLSFRIDQRPQHGEFEAPLYPYFIEDYRMSPVGPYGDWNTEFNPQLTPDTTSASIREIVQQRDGKFIVSANYDDSVRRINLDGSIDTSFVADPSLGPTYNVFAIAVQDDGRILLGGDFTMKFDGQPGAIVRLMPDGSLDDSFSPIGLNANPTTVLLLPNGGSIFGGFFTNAGGIANADYVIRVNSAGAINTNWLPHPNAGVRRVTTDPTGRVLLGGDFTLIGSQAAAKVARLRPNGTLDTTFSSELPTCSECRVSALDAGDDGRLFVGGLFPTSAPFGVPTGHNVAALTDSGALDPDFRLESAFFVQRVLDVEVQPDGKVLIGGQFGSYLGETSRARLTRLLPDGNLDPDFRVWEPFRNLPGVQGGYVGDVLVQDDGDIVFAGGHTGVGTRSEGHRDGLARLDTNGDLDTGFRNDFQTYFKHLYCDHPLYADLHRSERIPVDWVYRPSFFQVQDDGTVFIRDQFLQCNGTTSNRPLVHSRISKWDRDRNYLGHTTDIAGDSNLHAFEVDDTYIYSSDGRQNDRFIVQRTPHDFASGLPSDTYRICKCSGLNGDADVDFQNINHARLNDAGDLIYVTDWDVVSVWDARGLSGSSNPTYLANLTDVDILAQNLGGNSTGHNIAFDSEGNVYVAGTGRHRIHKFAPSFFDTDGTFVQGDYIGWMGRCTAGIEKRCDEDTQTTRGFSCTDATCSVDGAGDGDGPGQFDSPRYVTIDPNDIIYVADYDNQRVQRFSPDGTFAGVADSVADGVTNDGTFVLGNFGRPRHVTVNSNQFLILEGTPDESFLHSFETSPIKPESVTATSAEVTYVSDFVSGPADSFTFVASDGLADSAPATVDIAISRNFRDPIVVANDLGIIDVEVDEDESVTFDVVGDDPDGIAGLDFLGLDTLTFELATAPDSGSATFSTGDCATGASTSHRSCWTYTPDADFNGSDTFELRVVDQTGRTSPPVSVVITVHPVIDRPTVSMEPFTAFRGFPTTVTLDYSDADQSADEFFKFQLFFKDTFGEGDFTDVLTRGIERPFELYEGPTKTDAIDAVMAPGKGMVAMPYTYEEAGPQLISGCADNDFPSFGTDQCAWGVEIEVIEAAQVAVHLADPANPELPADSADFEPYRPILRRGQTIDLLAGVENLVPSSWPGLDADEVTATITTTVGTEIATPAGCVTIVTNESIECDLGSMSPGEVEELTLPVTAASRGFPAVVSTIDVHVAYNDSGTVRERWTSLPVTIDLLDTDEDGMPDRYELDTGLDPLVDDADGDIDGNGASNADDYYRTLLNNGVPPEVPTCEGRRVTIDMNINGGQGFGTAADDVILGTPFADVINALGGDDRVCAGAGNDTVFVGSGNDRVLGEAGDDTLFGATGNDYLNGGSGNDVIIGQGGRDSIFGLDGADDAFGMGANDAIWGGAGADKLRGNGGVDTIRGGPGFDQIWGNNLGDMLFGEGSRDIIRGGGGPDFIDGGRGDDALFGEANIDTVIGGTGADEIDGGPGGDICSDATAEDTAVSC